MTKQINKTLAPGQLKQLQAIQEDFVGAVLRDKR